MVQTSTSCGKFTRQNMTVSISLDFSGRKEKPLLKGLESRLGFDALTCKSSHQNRTKTTKLPFFTSMLQSFSMLGFYVGFYNNYAEMS